MNKDNLIPGAHKLTPEENRLGGINSAISRREKKRALEIARDILSMPVDDGDLKNVKDLSSLKDVSEVTTDVMTSLLAKITNKALKGDLRACQTLLTISGDYTTRQETVIEIGDQFDDDHTEHIIHIGSESPSHEVRYYDNDRNLVKAIYGEEAKRIIDRTFEERRKQGNIIDFEISGVTVVDEEDVSREE